MKLSKLQFEKLLEKNRLSMSFIGMSNIGKTFWSKKLQGEGFRHINCDDLIEKKLVPILSKLGYSGISDVSRWMGQPYNERFFANQNQYLSLEKQVMDETFTQVKNNNHGNTIIDTTGSVIHIGKNVSEMLKQYSMVVYIKASENMKELMFKKYIEEPKPVVFDDVYKQEEGETQSQALSKCYRKLLNLRSALYAKCADVVIPCEAINEGMTAKEFIQLVKQSI